MNKYQPGVMSYYKYANTGDAVNEYLCESMHENFDGWEESDKLIITQFIEDMQKYVHTYMEENHDGDYGLKPEYTQVYHNL